MTEMKISNTLVNDTSDKTIAYAEQLKQQIINWAEYNHVTEKLGPNNRPNTQNLLNNLFLRVYEEFLTFLNNADATDQAINTWKEIEAFLAGYTDDKTLASIVAQLNANIESRLSVQLADETGDSTITGMTQKAITDAIDGISFSTGEQVKEVGIDDEPTAGSEKLVKSGGVYNELALGVVYDVSAKNPTAGPNSDGKWESLSALLSDANLNTLIPTAYRKGGMSIKFIQSSDNKYVQYRLMADEWSIDTDDWVIADEGAFIENPEFCRVYTDKNKKIIFAVKRNGDIFFGAGVPQQVIDYVEDKIAELSLDEYEDIVAFLSGLEEGDKTLQQLFDGKVDKEDGKSLIYSTFADDIPPFISANENPEYADVKTDDEGKIIEGIRKDGTKEINVPVMMNDRMSVNGIIVETFDNEEFISLFIDSNKRIIYGIKKDGDVVFGYGVPKQIIDYVNSAIAELNQDIEELRDKIDAADVRKLMKVIKNGTNISIRTRLSETNDILLKMRQDYNGLNMSFYMFYVGAKTLSDSQLETNQYLVNSIADIVGAIGIQTFWFLYAQHGWTIPKMEVSSQTLDNSDIGSVWADSSYNNRRFVIGKVDGNNIYLIPEITKDNETDIYSAAWNGSMSYPTSLTHVSGATHTENIIGTCSRYDLHIQNVTKRIFLSDGIEITDDGTYYCDEFIIKENILGYNVGKVQTWFPTPQYDGSLIDWDRTFLFKGSMCTCNTIINCQYPFKLSDYRGCIPTMPLQVGDYHSYTFIPKVKALTNGHRVDLPFNSDDGTIGDNYVSVLRNDDSLYDKDNQPERCINYLKDNNGNYLVGMAGGCSLIRGISKPENRNIYSPVGLRCCTYGGGTPNKFYPLPLQSSGFPNGIIDESFIKEFSCYYCWFDPSANEGQVYWYKDDDSYIVYCHCQIAQSKLAINLPDFMEGMIVDSTIEKTDGATLLTTQVVSGKLYVSYDITDNAANYIVLKLK